MLVAAEELGDSKVESTLAWHDATNGARATALVKVVDCTETGLQGHEHGVSLEGGFGRSVGPARLLQNELQHRIRATNLGCCLALIDYYAPDPYVEADVNVRACADWFMHELSTA